MSQSKEEREAGAKKIYLGNGRVVYTEGAVTVAEREDAQASTPVGAPVAEDALPFWADGDPVLQKILTELF